MSTKTQQEIIYRGHHAHLALKEAFVPGGGIEYYWSIRITKTVHEKVGHVLDPIDIMDLVNKARKLIDKEIDDEPTC